MSDAYVPYMAATFAYFERNAQALFGRDVRQILRVHAKFDDAYSGAAGITWLHRWALTRKMPMEFFAGEPETPAFVAEAARP